MFESLTKNISKAVSNLRGKKILNSADIDEVIKEIRVALLEADVGLDVVQDFCRKVSEKAVGEEIVKSVSAEQMFIKIVQDEITNILSSGHQELELSNNKDVILIVGLQGSGKTTSTAKLAKYLQDKHSKKVLVAGVDIYRPAAQEQLAIMAQKAGVDSVPIVPKEKPEKILKRSLKILKKEDYDILLVDTAGRLSIDKELIKELKNLKKLSSPVETILVADSLTGQDAVNTARNFNDEVALTGIILTRIDGDQRGGAALSMKYETNVPIKFMGMGEDIKEFDKFQPERISTRILDMGDIVSLVEKAQEVVNDEEAAEIEARFRKGQVSLDDLLKQIRNMKRMGGIGTVLGLMPGAGKIKEMMERKNINEKDLIHQEAIILSMTMFERVNPEKLNTSRKRRIAKGSGSSMQQVNSLLKKFKNMQKVVKKMKGRDPAEVMNMFGNIG